MTTNLWVEPDHAPENDDPSNQCVALDAHLGWLQEIGFADVDCFWKWRELALVSGVKEA
jgi:tRNA (cmo5U34)-methyltransferase